MVIMSKEAKQLTWFAIYQNPFFHQGSEFLERLQKDAEDLATACVKSVKSEVQKANAEIVETI